jgi:hypothetical protein
VALFLALAACQFVVDQDVPASSYITPLHHLVPTLPLLPLLLPLLLLLLLLLLLQAQLLPCSWR